MQPEKPNHSELDVDLSAFTHRTVLPTTLVSKRIDGFLRAVGEASSWVWMILMATIIINVFMRYALGEGRIEFEEMQWHLYAIGWLFGLSYCFSYDEHVRVDLIHDRMTLRMQAWVEFLGILFLLAPFVAVVTWYAIPFISYSWVMSEISTDPGGLPYRWAIKAMLLIGFILLALAVISRFSRVVALLFGGRAPATQYQLNRA